MRNILKTLSPDWGRIDRVVLFGWGTYGPAARLLDIIQKDFEIVAVIDNDLEKVGTVIHNRIPPIMDTNKGFETMKQNKIIVTTYTNAYNQIKKNLIKNGFVEGRDFCSLEQFIVEWYWRFKKKANIFELHTSVTTKCSLNCFNCNMFIPYHKTRVTYSFETIKEEIDKLFSCIDFVYIYEWLGGEAFINRDFSRILDYVGDNYRNNIGQFGIITNGMVMPENEEIWSIIKEHNILVTISDYTKKVTYKEKLELFIEKLKEYGISFSIRDLSKWKDYGFPIKVRNYKNIKDHMLCCGPMFHGYNDYKLYYCHVSWAAEKGELIVLDKTDYINLREFKNSFDEKENLLRYMLGEWDGNYLNMCQYCGGCGTDNTTFVEAGIQMRK